MARYYNMRKPYVTEVHIADVHFGSINPETEYQILREQFLFPISKLDFDILSIDGDLFDKKFLANSPVITFANMFIQDCANLCITKGATLILLAGTRSHDAGQLSMFYYLQEQPNIDCRIVQHCQFEFAQGLKILCIPEEYGMPQEYYVEKLIEEYDTAFVHGTVVDSVYGANTYILDSKKAPVFNLDAFSGCRGPIILGHVHKAMCLNSYMYYVSNPIRYRFGEEEEKGYAIVLHGSKSHYYKFMPIKSFRYDTINVANILKNDPKDVINYLDALKLSGIDHIRLDFSDVDNINAQNIIAKYYESNPNISIKRYNNNDHKEIITDEHSETALNTMSFLIDNSIDSYTKFVNFVNQNEGKDIITVDQLKSILAGGSIS